MWITFLTQSNSIPQRITPRDFHHIKPTVWWTFYFKNYEPLDSIFSQSSLFSFFFFPFSLLLFPNWKRHLFNIFFWSSKILNYFLIRLYRNLWLVQKSWRFCRENIVKKVNWKWSLRKKTFAWRRNMTTFEKITRHVVMLHHVTSRSLVTNCLLALHWYNFEIWKSVTFLTFIFSSDFTWLVWLYPFI